MFVGKCEILRLAIRYIKLLDQVLSYQRQEAGEPEAESRQHGTDYTDHVFSPEPVTPGTSPTSSDGAEFEESEEDGEVA